MKTTYRLTGMTCGSCEAKVKASLMQVDGVKDVEVSKEEQSASIEATESITIERLQSTLADKYQISDIEVSSPSISTSNIEQNDTERRSWFQTYKPVVLIFLYLFSVSLFVELRWESIDVMRWMRHFMAGFFLTFSFFKLLNLEGFKNSYAMYDKVAQAWPTWGYIYPFVELALGVSFLMNFAPQVTLLVTLIVMSVSIIGVLQTVLDKKKIQCACLGDVFNLPMSTVTIIEDGLMIVMALVMLLF